jgi:uncharacterized iron-regulated membrane protein
MASLDFFEGSWRRWLRIAHLWIGLAVCLPAAMLGVTGTILVYEDEINEIFAPQPKRVSTAPGLRMPGEIVAAASRASPAGSEVLGLAVPMFTKDPAMVRFVPPNFQPPGLAGTVVYVDPATLDVLGTRELGRGVDVMREIFLLHANLSSERDGRDAVGWFGVGMLVLGVSGLVIFWPRKGRWKAALFMRRGTTGYRFHRDLHAMVGFWGLIVFLVVTFTGVFVCFPQTVGGMVRSVAPGQDLRTANQALRVEAPAPGTARISLDRAYEIARAQAEGLRLRSINLPRRATQPMTVGFSVYGPAGGSPGHGPPQLVVHLDPYRGQVLTVRDPRTYTFAEAMQAWLMPVHAGHGTGWLWRLLVAVSGLMPVVFAVTGPTMWWLERRARRRAVRRGYAVETKL